MTEPPALGASALCARLGLHAPTPQQRAVIEAPLAPALVVAGAGSGKTETMALRVLWLIANSLVSAEQVLGLTFTRKAASELQHRVRERLGLLQRAGLAARYDEFDPPTITTYNAFANGVYRDRAHLLGREADGVVLGEASAWQLARRVVVESVDERIGDLDVGVEEITRRVLGLASELGEHAADPAAIAELADRYRAALEALPLGGSAEYRDDFQRVLRPGTDLPVLLPLVAEFQERKRQRGALQYADQVSLALAIAERESSVGAALRDRYRVVLLDEYQDTSVVQTRLLSTLFSSAPVMAVGDPHQSIYGWRGASSANLEQFDRDFGLPAEGRPYPLTVSWRNGTGVLAVANALAAPLTAEAAIPVEQLLPAPTASHDPVESVFAETIEQEADAVAGWFAARLAGGGPTSAAMLMRARRTTPVFLAALRRHGVPYHVLGVGGLLQEPEVADLVSALKVLDDAQAGVALVRLLAGGIWRVGPADLWALARLARRLQHRDATGRPLADDVRAVLGRSIAEGESASLVDALDLLAADPEHPEVTGFSRPGLRRLAEAGRRFAALRARSALELPDLVHLVVETLGLDVEVAANDARGGLDALQAFDQALAGYLAVVESGSLRGFLGWLELAEHKEDLSPRSDPPEPGTVQVLTVHGAKGLEWDVVAVPRLVAGELPAESRDTQGWLRSGALPWSFRGDAGELPDFGWQRATTRKELVTELKRFKLAVKARDLAEERRLVYVAVTRARHRLLLSGAFWSTQQKPRGPSPFLTDLVAAGLLPELPAAPAEVEKPEGAPPAVFQWPRDPLGTRRVEVEAAARAVRGADPEAAGRWGDRVDALVAERAEQRAGPVAVPLPARVAASRFREHVEDPQTAVRRLRRPMPQRPSRASRLGTRFHTWVEQRSGGVGTAELVDAGPFEEDADEEAPGVGLAELQARFTASEWGGLDPLEVESEIQLPFEGRIVVCKLDAVYRRGDRIEIVDWKTGAVPSGAGLALAELQLALYRLAYATREGIDPDRIDTALYYVAADRVLRPERTYSATELRLLWRRVATSG